MFALLFLPLALTMTGAEPEAPAARGPGPVLWDTQTPLPDKLDPQGRANWKAVPGDLLLLEKDHLKSSSDPGYYGREYSFQGDAVVETPTIAAAFSCSKGRVALYAKENGSPSADWRQLFELAPIMPGSGAVALSNKEVVRNAGDQVALKVSFSQAGSPPAAAVFTFDRTGIVEVKPEDNMKRVRLSGSIQYGVVPAFIGDDLIYGTPEQPAEKPLTVPVENMFVGLLEGENSELVMTWPRGRQRLALQLAEAGSTSMKSVDFDSDGQSFYLAALSAPGIWHKEPLTTEFLEKDVKIKWQKPFPARWKTQLFEEELKTSFAFRSFKGQVWRGVAGSYQYPVWFSGDDAFYHLGKKVQPKGESLVYCLEAQDTPATVLTPADVLKQALGRQAAGQILDFEGRKLRTHHRRGGDGVRRACTCGCTEAIQAVFEAGEEASQTDYIQSALDDMIYFVHRHVDRINEYQKFADTLLKKIQEKKRSAPELKSFLESLEEIARQIPQECEVQKENMKDFAYADELSKKTVALAAKKDPGNLKAYMALLKAWRDMGGAQDYVVAKCHTVTRNLCQTAGYGCATLPAAVPLAEEIRLACKQVLRNPDGYEIWADY